MKLNEQIKVAREARGLTREQLAERLGVSKVSVYWWEKGDHSPRLAMLGMIEDCLGTKFNTTGTKAPEGQSETFPGVSPKILEMAIALSRLPLAMQTAIETMIMSSQSASTSSEGRPFFELVSSETPAKKTPSKAGNVHAAKKVGSKSASPGTKQRRSVPGKGAH